MLVGCWQEDGDKGIEGQRDKVTDTRSLDPLIPRSLAPESPGLWSGEGGLAKYFSTKPLSSLPEVQWEAMPNRAVLAITRTRRELP
jgi:hypothetical protein